MTKVRFLKSPTGTHKLAYNIGEIGLVDSEVAKDLVNKGIAVLVESKSASVGLSNDAQESDQTQKKSTRSRKTYK
jgi:hypothetical protein